MGIRLQASARIEDRVSSSNADGFEIIPTPAIWSPTHPAVARVTEDTILDQIGLLSHLRCAAHHIGFGSMGPDATAHDATAHDAAARVVSQFAKLNFHALVK